MPHSFDAKPDSPTKKERQYYAILGIRGICRTIEGFGDSCRAHRYRAISTRMNGRFIT